MAFIDPSKRRQTIADHVDFCRGFLKIFGCTHFKINMGSRPQNGTTVDDIKAIAETVLELGQRTLEMGVTIAPHPHIWGPIERPEEVRALLDQTDPDIVSWIPDTAQLNLGGGDPLQLIDITTTDWPLFTGRTRRHRIAVMRARHRRKRCTQRKSCTKIWDPVGLTTLLFGPG